MRRELDELIGMLREPRPQVTVRICRRVEGGTVNAATRYAAPGRYEIRVARGLVRHRPIGHLRATLAHEAAHAHYGDPDPVRKPTSWAVIVALICGLLLPVAVVVGTAAATLAYGLGAGPGGIAFTGVACFLEAPANEGQAGRLSARCSLVPV